MPIGNNFQHSEYDRKDPGDRVAYGELPTGASPDSPAWLDAMAEHGKRLGGTGVRAVIFLHGTHLSSDLFGAGRLDEAGGLKRGYSRGIPGMEALLALMRQDTNGVPTMPGEKKLPYANDGSTKQLIDGQAGDAGNFTNAYVELFKRAVSRNAPRPIMCARDLWSCEQHHLGRAEAAVRLFHRLHALCAEHSFGAGDRILVQAHGQAGLIMALLSNLLAPGKSAIREMVLKVLKGVVPDSEIALLESPVPGGGLLNGVMLDVVTFGTPVRYGWDPSGLGKLLHVVNHRPMRVDGKRWLAKMELPQITMEMPIAWGGDYVQQLAVAGSDAGTGSEGAKAANKALWELLEPLDGFERWLECARKSVRCQNDGLCLLIDYKDSTGSTSARDHLYGHAAYTRTHAMLFNTSEMVQALYS
ncbi:MAG: hypothetical protein EXR96_08910 [Nitrospiraceae bacterium]|nr:hypothetical protein [Nitrospiraceae bacterium]